MSRPDWDTYFMQIAELVATRSTCIRRSVGAIIVKDKRVLTTGYNGAPRGIPHCTEKTCLRSIHNVPSGTMHELCRGVHAEQNAIIQAAFHGIKIEGASVYVTTQPCSICTKLLINSGINTFYYKNPYNDELALQLMDEAGVERIIL